MASKARGRGYALSKNAQSGELRRPGETNGAEKVMNPPQINGKESAESKPAADDLGKLCEKISHMELTLPRTALDAFAEELKGICTSADKLEKCADKLFTFALKSKWNAHAVAVFCEAHGDVTVGNVKLRNLVLKKLQAYYIERNRCYLNLDKFLLESSFACELFHHLRVGGSHLRVLAVPILDYLGMLIDGASPREVEVFMEQFPKCCQNLKEAEEFNVLLTKIRKQILSETTPVTVKAMLLEMFELILLDFKDLNPCVKKFYETLSKPVVRICN